MKSLQEYLNESVNMMNNAYIFTPDDIKNIEDVKDYNLAGFIKDTGIVPKYLAIKNKEIYLGFSDGSRCWFTTQFPAARLQTGTTPYDPNIGIEFIKHYGGCEGSFNLSDNGYEDLLTYVAWQGLIWALERGTNNQPPAHR